MLTEEEKFLLALEGKNYRFIRWNPADGLLSSFKEWITYDYSMQLHSQYIGITEMWKNGDWQDIRLLNL